MSKSQNGGLWSRLKSIAVNRNEGFTVIPGNRNGGLHVRYEDGSVSVVPMARSMYNMSHIR